MMTMVSCVHMYIGIVYDILHKSGNIVGILSLKLPKELIQCCRKLKYMLYFHLKYTYYRIIKNIDRNKMACTLLSIFFVKISYF